MPSASTINKGLFLLLIILVGVGCNDKAKEKEKVIIKPHAIPPEEGFDIVSYLSEAGLDKGTLEAKVKGKLTAPYMLRVQRADSPYAEFPRTLHVDFFKDSILQNQRPTIESELDARYGKYLQNQNKVFLRDSVVVKNVLNGDTLHCKYLWWDQKTERFSTDDSVAIFTKDKILYGTGMDADQNFRNYNIAHMTGTVLTTGNTIPGGATK